MRTLKEIAQALESQRRELRITYDDLANAAGLTPLATRRALKAEAAPRVTTLMALADKLGLEVMVVPKAVAAGMQAPSSQVFRPLSRVERLTLPESQGQADALQKLAPPRAAMGGKPAKSPRGEG